MLFTFDGSLDDPTYYFAAWKDGALRRIELPRVGASLDLPFERGPWLP